MKPWNHQDLFNTSSYLYYFQGQKNNVKRPTLDKPFPKESTKDSDKLQTSYNTALLIARLTINKIRSNSFNDRLFRKLCIENGEESNCLLRYIKGIQLSKRACLSQTFKFFDRVLEIKDNSLWVNLINSKTYLTDWFFDKFN